MSHDSIFKARSAGLIEAGRLLHARGMVPATSGNLSARVDDSRIAITASGRHKGELGENDIMTVDMQGNFVDDRRPSAETLLHLQIYRCYPETGCVLHPHSINATVLSRIASDTVVLQDYELLKAFTGINSHDCRVTVPNFCNDQNIERLTRRIDTWLDNFEGQIFGYLISGHGFYTWGNRTADALRHLEALEFLFECELHNHGARTS